VLAVSAFAVAGEISSYVAAGGTDAAFFDRLAQASPAPAISRSGAEAVLMRCESVVAGQYGARQTDAERMFALGHCWSFAAQTLEQMPSYSYGWYTLALFQLSLGDLESGLQSLSQSQRAGRNEQWVAERRVHLGELVLSELDPETRAGHDADLTMLAQSNRGVRSIAQRYIKNEEFRGRITAIVETLPEETQVRFVSRVRAAAREASMDTPPT
jgi:ATP/maltotriose-dependent transcriptional regulator MalT